MFFSPLMPQGFQHDARDHSLSFAESGESSEHRDEGVCALLLHRFAVIEYLDWQKVRTDYSERLRVSHLVVAEVHRIGLGVDLLQVRLGEVRLERTPESGHGVCATHHQFGTLVATAEFQTERLL